MNWEELANEMLEDIASLTATLGSKRELIRALGEKMKSGCDDQVQRVAKMMAAAYWRGRLDVLHPIDDPEKMFAISEAAELYAPKWIASACYAVTGNFSGPDVPH